MQVLYKESTRDGVKSKVAKREFDWKKTSENVRIEWKIDQIKEDYVVKFRLFTGKWPSSEKV